MRIAIYVAYLKFHHRLSDQTFKNAVHSKRGEFLCHTIPVNLEVPLLHDAVQGNVGHNE